MFNFDKIKKIFTFRNILLVSFYVFIFFIFLYNSYSYLDPDFGWHLKFGQETLLTKQVPHIEHYNFTLFGKSWVDHEWLLNVIVYVIYSKMGYLYVNLFFAFMAVLTFIIINILLLKKYKTKIFDLIILLLLELLAVFGILPHFGVRVQEINFLFLAILILIIFHFEKNKNYKILLFIAPLLFFWSFLHGGFLIGFALLFIFFSVKILELIFQKFKKINFIEYNILSIKDLIIFTCVSLFSFFLTFLGPYKFELYSFLYQYKDTFYLTHIAEWVPVFYIPISISKFFYLVILVSIILLAFFYIKFKKIKLFEFFITIFFVILSIKSKRHFPLLFISSIFFAFDYLIFLFYDFSNFLNKIYREIYFIYKIFIIVFLLSISLFLFLNIGFIEDPFLNFKNEYPVDLLDCIKNQKQNHQRVFMEYGWGGYTIWTAPEIKTFLDGRLPQYPFKNNKSILQEYNHFFDDKESERLLDEYNIKMLVLKKENEKNKLNWLERFFGFNEKTYKPSKNALKEYLNSSNKWMILCKEKIGIVFIRK
ncbi:MAG: hypothetical protein PHH83_00020 [Patescibacteria group bacterium]|nr:hypothetical protein [Patescibacteria group bacterium]